MADSSLVQNITDGNFEEVTGKGVSIVDFWAPWCAPCRFQGPILEKVAAQVGDKAQICKINVDEHSQFAQKFGVTGIPTLLVFKDGEKVEQFVGVQQEGVLVSAVEKAQ